ncbi:SDR family NAD(P)-dependent oxidoreductase [Microbacterium ulmi]|uniref:SDR family oxidoreductase n=1 Tax=Microbacterium ulmi TaxID=179095 RepID=A0A7Y2Q122_9MICO|nr:SDR family oxidoreductase [Microbacterium ulmi]NII69264.1 3-oxoacyl-[acyl-carrier protein] reductase [Microbacterium ulmi]NNH04943.1 SDR family oxidoreductase [Microbacterium ulmi]
MSGVSTVVITGSGSGIGQATAARYLEEGAAVYGFDRAEAQPHPLPGGPGAWVPVRVDVSDPAGIAEAFETVEADRGGVDVLVTSAAVGFPEPFADMTVASWDRVFGINVTGTMLSIKAVLPGMVARGSGSVVVVSSIAGRTRSVANGAHYTVTKYGLIGLTRHLAAELAGSGVRINCVAPGPTNSPILTAATPQDEIDAIIARTPLRRIAEPEDVANVIAFVADDRRARQLHGAVLDVNGGLY